MLVPTSLPTIITASCVHLESVGTTPTIISPFTISDTTLQVYNLTPGKPQTTNCKFTLLPMDFKKCSSTAPACIMVTLAAVSLIAVTTVHASSVIKVTGKV